MDALEAARMMLRETRTDPFDLVGHHAAIGRLLVITESLVGVCEEQGKRIAALEAEVIG